MAKDFGISETCLTRWLNIADREDGLLAVTTYRGGGNDESVERRELRRRNKLL